MPGLATKKIGAEPGLVPRLAGWLAKLKTRKGGLGKNEHPAGLTTRKGQFRQKWGIEKNLFPWWIENPKGRSRQKWDAKNE
ncbi:hypothetical protein MTR_7g461390 [Medicago truncatula]|uniref:Uncharacterized protein n=1 Tax=Medicago truncatula TaxID=3880 RepID=A0A072UAQ0_MEDTR|nr:hypothetical protein MTR_7g461390 [Medicago truncatula]